MLFGSFKTSCALKKKSLNTFVTHFGPQTSTSSSDFGWLSPFVLCRTTLEAFLRSCLSEFVTFIQTSCGRKVFVIGRDFLPLRTDIFASHLTHLSTPGRPDLSGGLCIATLWPVRRTARRLFVALSSPRRRHVKCDFNRHVHCLPVHYYFRPIISKFLG